MLNAAQATKQLLATLEIAFEEAKNPIKIAFEKERRQAQPIEKLIELDVSKCIYVCNFCSDEIVFTVDPRPLRKHQAYECVALPDDKLSEMQAAYKSVRKLSAHQLAMLAHMIKHGPTKSRFKSFEAFFSVNDELIVMLH